MAPTAAARRRPLTAGQLAALARAVDERASLPTATPLLGGLDTATYLLLLDGEGWHRDAVVRVYRDWDGDAAEAVRRTWNVLVGVSAQLDLAPRPLVSDPAGEILGEPLIVMSRIRGRPALPTRLDPRWSAEFAAALARVHRVTADRVPAGFRVDDDPPGRLARMIAEAGDVRDPLWDRIVSAIRPAAGLIPRTRSSLIHADYWSGNTLWEDGRLTGIVDWGGARLGDPALDVGYARGDLNLMLGPGAADDLVERYSSMNGPVEHLAFWDLMTSLPAVRWLEEWIPGYHELGPAHIDLDGARARLSSFVEAALVRLRGSDLSR